jgi:hypothetical protein
MTMDQDRLNEIVRFLGENPTPPPGAPVTAGDQHVHIHYHQAPVNTAPVDQNPGQSVLEKYAPYYVMFLGGLVIIAGATVILMFAFAAVAMILLVLLGVVAGLIVLGIVGAILIRSWGESGSLRDLARAQAKQRRR